MVKFVLGKRFISTRNAWQMDEQTPGGMHQKPSSPHQKAGMMQRMGFWLVRQGKVESVLFKGVLLGIYLEGANKKTLSQQSKYTFYDRLSFEDELQLVLSLITQHRFLGSFFFIMIKSCGIFVTFLRKPRKVS